MRKREAECRDADLVYQRSRRKKPSDILAMGQYRSKGGYEVMILSLAQQKVFGREIDIGSKIICQVWKASLSLIGA